MSISKEGYSDWAPHPSLSQVASSSARWRLPPALQHDPLSALLRRVAARLESREHNPRWKLHRCVLASLARGGAVRSAAELGAALQPLRLALDDGELQLLCDSFARPDGEGRIVVDLQAMADALYPPQTIEPPTRQTHGWNGGSSAATASSSAPWSGGATAASAAALPAYSEEKESSLGLSVSGSGSLSSRSAHAGAHIIGDVPARATGRRRLPAPGTSAALAAAATQEGGAGGSTTARVPVQSLHTLRSSGALQRAANAALSSGGSPAQRRAAHGGKGDSSSRFHGAECLGADAQLGSGTTNRSAARAPNHSIPRVDFLHLDKYEARYERSAASKQASNKQYVHTAR